MRAKTPAHVCVMGAGIVGLSCAWSLQRQGHRVTVIDQGDPGMGTSLANGGQLSYSYVQPLAEPGIWAQLPKLLLEPNSPLRWQWQADPHQWHWLAQFLAACRRETANQTTRELLQLAAESRAVFEQLRGAGNLQADFNDAGKLVLYPTEKSFSAARKQLELQRALGGAAQQPLTPAEARTIEPALAASQEPFAGAIYTPSECAADSHKVCTHLAASLRDQGATLMINTAVQQLVVAERRVQHAVTDQGTVEADAFVLALGWQSRALARPLGLNLPLYPLKGYSLTVDLPSNTQAAPRVSMTDAGRKVVFARLGDRLRVAGMVELVGADMSIQPQRMAQLRQSVQAWWPAMGEWTASHTWAGLRPATPTGLPLLGRHRNGPENLLLNTGHGALGFTLAFGSAHRIAQQLR